MDTPDGAIHARPHYPKTATYPKGWNMWATPTTISIFMGRTAAIMTVFGSFPESFPRTSPEQVVRTGAREVMSRLSLRSEETFCRRVS